MGINKGAIRKGFLGMLSLTLTAGAVFCTMTRICSMDPWDQLSLLAAATAMPRGTGGETTENTITAVKPERVQRQETMTTQSSNSSEESSLPAPGSESVWEFESTPPDPEALAAYQKAHQGEAEYPVIEFTTTQGNVAYDGIQVKNTASVEIDIQKELQGKLGFAMEDTKEPQVLIYHTHTSESFLPFDTGYYYESFYPRSSDPRQNVCAIGEEIVRQLNHAGISALHDTTIHDDPTYNGAYYRSADTVQKYLEKYPSIKVVIDIHRDGIGTETQRSKPVFTVNGKKAAQIMVLAGYNYDGSEAFRHWEYNLRFALQIQKKAQDKYPDMVRPLNFSDFVYNMDINPGSLLIEVGADSNTVEEVRYTGWLLGDVLSEVLQDPKNHTKT